MIWHSTSPPASRKNWVRYCRQSAGCRMTKIIGWIFLMPWRSRSIVFAAGDTQGGIMSSPCVAMNIATLFNLAGNPARLAFCTTLECGDECCILNAKRDPKGNPVRSCTQRSAGRRSLLKNKTRHCNLIRHRAQSRRPRPIEKGNYGFSAGI